MKLHYLLPALLLCTAPCSALSIEPDTEVPTLTASQKRVLNNTAKQIADFLKKSEKVCDLASADTFASAVKTPVPELQQKLHQAKLEKYDLNRALSAYGYTADDLLKRESELAQEYFYGSAALAAVFGAPAEATEQPVPAPEEVLEVLEELLEEKDDHLPASFTDGGPGFTRDTAWEADESYGRNPQTVVRLIPGGRFKCLIHKEHEIDGNFYDVFTFDFKHEGKLYSAEMWIDVTDYVEEREEELPFSREEIAEAEQKIISLGLQLYTLMNSVHDKESADAAAEAMMPLYSDYMDMAKNGILDYVSEEKVNTAVQQQGHSIDFLDIKAEELEHANYYGSDKLREIINR